MFHAPMGRFQLELFIFITYFFHRRLTYKLCFLSYRPFVINATFSTGLIVSSVSWLGQLTVGVQITNLNQCRINDERLREKKTQLVSGTTVEKIGNKNK